MSKLFTVRQSDIQTLLQQSHGPRAVALEMSADEAKELYYILSEREDEQGEELATLIDEAKAYAVTGDPAAYVLLKIVA